jgi:fatty-acyl-CoA synthase
MMSRSNARDRFSGSETRQAGFADLGELIGAVARRTPGAIAVDDGTRAMSYETLDSRSNRAANLLSAAGVGRGDRFAVLAENRIEYLELALAAARTGSTLCALNWRFSPSELDHCIRLTSLSLLFVSRRHSSQLRDLDLGGLRPIVLEDEYESRLDAASGDRLPPLAEPEDGLLILYTSGTTGFPKGALISHRAELARLYLSQIDSALQPGDAFVAWAPMFTWFPWSTLCTCWLSAERFTSWTARTSSASPIWRRRFRSGGSSSCRG